ncbi:dual oxidase maturation factor 1-like [Spea bombifrons]|uniref:dual oxidase maturation factor 1-like n=1 Tax=Spea bombifrons TaxID=233779 RepID=UPI002349D609|nr:dual oxidase maturation factor 1-like [Spea bombifrons]
MHSTFPFYSQPRTPFMYDTKIVEIVVICIVTTCTFIIILPGIRGKQRLSWLLKVLTSLFIGAVILAVNFTRDWEVGSVTTTTVYKSFSNAMVNVSIGLWVGLKGVNITLSGIPIQQLNETINYNEEFDWDSGMHFEKDYEESLERGLPNPILYVAEKFTMNSPCRLHQQYSISAYYSSALMWLAFCSWIFCNLLFSMPVLIYGIYMMFATALCILISLISFASVSQTKCSIQFGIAVLQTRFGLSFWISLGTGTFCLILSLVLITVYIADQNILRRFFNDIDVAKDLTSNKEEGSLLDDNRTIMLHEML